MDEWVVKGGSTRSGHHRPVPVPPAPLPLLNSVGLGLNESRGEGGMVVDIIGPARGVVVLPCDVVSAPQEAFTD